MSPTNDRHLPASTRDKLTRGYGRAAKREIERSGDEQMAAVEKLPGPQKTCYKSSVKAKRRSITRWWRALATRSIGKMVISTDANRLAEISLSVSEETGQARLWLGIYTLFKPGDVRPDIQLFKVAVVTGHAIGRHAIRTGQPGARAFIKRIAPIAGWLFHLRGNVGAAFALPIPGTGDLVCGTFDEENVPVICTFLAADALGPARQAQRDRLLAALPPSPRMPTFDFPFAGVGSLDMHAATEHAAP